jgi:diguanylate cyclase
MRSFTEFKSHTILAYSSLGHSAPNESKRDSQQMAATASRLFRFFASTGERPAEPQAVSPAIAPPLTAIDRANERVMQEIADFLISSRLAITGHNLLLAHSAFSGADPQLSREIGRMRLAGQPVTQGWLDDRAIGDDHETAIKALIDQLEHSLDRFAATALKAHVSAADCHAELAQQVDRATQAEARLDLDDVLALAQVVLDQSRKLETDIRASEQETRGLREKLARAQRDAEIDHLTGLPNRRTFEAMFDREYREAQTEVDHLCVAFCDIDHFKLVNDNHGHETGDRVIQAVAETLDRLSGKKCHVARHGGEEFVLLFRGLNKAQTREKLDAVRESFSQRRFVKRKTDDPIGRVTFSGGVADVFAYPSPRDALRAADEALYLAKAQGRNAIMAAP